ncbi:hypothetical protein Pd630_LPD16161 (plasmid) [Rhodococcus opacus PD630]|nr:hypothetical protein Pd630_LPD16161 [Rhodococcus opacus PD630]
MVENVARARECRAMLQRSDIPISIELLEHPRGADLLEACTPRSNEVDVRRVVIAATEPTGWTVAVGLSSLRQRLQDDDKPLVLLVTDVADEFVPIHISDFPRLQRVNQECDLPNTILQLLS